MIFALAGNQNCGKTTLFNQLTGANQHVGNFPGVTVDQKMGEIRSAKNCTVVDRESIRFDPTQMRRSSQGILFSKKNPTELSILWMRQT